MDYALDFRGPPSCSKNGREGDIVGWFGAFSTRGLGDLSFSSRSELGGAAVVVSIFL